MSLLRSLVAPEKREASLSEALGLMRQMRGVYGSDKTPVIVSADSSLRHSAVWSSVNLISDLPATMPLHVYRDTGRDRAERLRSQDFEIVSDPSYVLPATEVRRQCIVSCLLRGNAWGLVLERERVAGVSAGIPTKTEILNPDEVGVRRIGKLGRLEVRWNGMELGPDDYWRMVGYTFPGSPVGLSPISYVAETLGLGLSVQRYGLDWFSEGAHPSAVLSNEKANDVGTDDQVKKVKERFLDSIRGKREPVVLGGGWKYETIQIAPEESQFLDTIGANRATVATIFGLDPVDIGEQSGGSLHYQTDEHRQIARLVYPISQWLVRLENAISGLLPPDLFVKFNPDAVLRVDLKRRYEAHAAALRHGFLSQNEVRELENREPIEDGDKFLWPPLSIATSSISYTTDEGDEPPPNAS